MKTAPEHLIYESAFRGNVLPVTSVCNVNCIFCSHRQNPPGIQIYKTPHRTRRQVEETLQFISPDTKIVIGESVTRIIEGEPFTNPEIKDILYTVRNHFPATKIQVTTNGTLIDQGTAGFLAELTGLEITLSLNSAIPATRRRLMDDGRAETAVRAAERLALAGVPYHGSVVAMPHLTGWDDLGETLSYLAFAGARTIRVFLPGFTKLAPAGLKYPPDLWRELAVYVQMLADVLQVPVTLEPPSISDLLPRVTGVIKGSPAAVAGLMKDDIITSVDGYDCISRVDAFQKIKCGGPVHLKVLRRGRPVSLALEKKPGEPSGVVMDYDIDPALVAEIKRVARKYEKVKLLCSVLGAPVLSMALEADDPGSKFNIITVKNDFFGGTIISAGLLLVPDFLAAVRNVATESGKPEALFLPAAAFDSEGRDLAGNSYLEIQEETGLKVEIL